jgi:mannose-6-phosphate isomerase class I
MTLKEWLDVHPEALGERVAQRFGSDLPFLFKVVTSALQKSQARWQFPGAVHS